MAVQRYRMYGMLQGAMDGGAALQDVRYAARSHV
jgi:hypothetical protein